MSLFGGVCTDANGCLCVSVHNLHVCMRVSRHVS